MWGIASCGAAGARYQYRNSDETNGVRRGKADSCGAAGERGKAGGEEGGDEQRAKKRKKSRSVFRPMSLGVE